MLKNIIDVTINDRFTYIFSISRARWPVIWLFIDNSSCLKFLPNCTPLTNQLLQFEICFYFCTTVLDTLERHEVGGKVLQPFIALITLIVPNRNSISKVNCKAYCFIINNYYILNLSLIQKLYEIFDLIPSTGVGCAAITGYNVIKELLISLNLVDNGFSIGFETSSENYQLKVLL